MKTIRIKDIDLCYEIFGEGNSQNLVLISGLGSQMIRWNKEFCDFLVEKGFKVIRFDNRDSGSSVFNTKKEIPSSKGIEETFAALGKDGIPYSLMDMANDVIGLLDYLKIEKAHIAGRSMGGIIAQLLGSYYPERVLSLTIIMSTSLNPTLPKPDPEVMAMMTKVSADPFLHREEYFREKLHFAEKISGSKYLFDPNREKVLLEEELHRSRTKNGIIRQLMAMGSFQYDPNMLKKITAPALIVHGTDDLIFHPDCGKDIADSIPFSEFVLIEGMGHYIPRELYNTISESIFSNINKKLPY
ncbi:alpha/beta hydrolase [Chryseobacterium sp.]|jgi:pimeloyl-ACP methyl ester carboxylesterase|uniref:alpha/beta fold hydrolase n=1 Tax=Chryseobacterium sp. TaxID=1871047 RepID=UPI00283C386C|nr:alpha/beta hydrolase [Chryseobacterium sp.]MDR3023755.1 alpha/beta fold hydrolase [Chryseobacterium sp.]